jgi:tetratricopeptide (TPR) repeat protein/transcriptional regulator with XRE-family HTH domain
MVDGPVAGQAGLGFGGLLRRLREDAGLTQDELAEAARVSQRAISDLERGINATARKDTAVLLAGALGLDGPARALFVAAARGRAAAGEALAAAAGEAWAGSAAAASRTLPRDIAAFIGRTGEVERLTAGLAGAAPGGGVVGICAIGGMAGIGKTTLAVHAAHRLAGRFPDGQIFLPLHGHTPGQRPVDPADALASLLLAAGISAQAIPAGLDARAGLWRDFLAGKKVLLVLDDAAGHEQVGPLLPGTAGSLVLITSRRRLAALEDAAVISLDTLPPDEAAVLLARLAGRRDLGPGDAGVGEITRLCGYLPLAIGMLGRQLAHHPAWTTAGLAAELAAAAGRLELMAAENLSVAAAFDLSYRDLTAGQRRLFRRLGVHPGPDIDAYAAAALAGTGLAAASRHLEALYGQHLITEPARGRYRLHDLLREHARALAAADDPAAREAAASRLLDYYLHTALAAGQHIVARVPARRPPPPAQPPACAPQLPTAGQATAWLEAERPNLHAAAGYAAASALPRHAIAIPAAMSDFMLAHGHWEQAAALHQTALTTARQAGDRPGQAAALTQLGVVQWLTGNYPAATANIGQALEMFRDLGDRPGQASALRQLGIVQQLTGNYPAAAASYQTALATARQAGDRPSQAFALNDLGRVQQLTGNYPAATAYSQQALVLYRDLGDRLGQGDALNALGSGLQLTGDYPAAAAALRQALELFRDLGDRYGEAGALYDLGVVQRLTGDYPAAAASLARALDLNRGLGDRLGQAEARNELGVVQQLTGDYPAAAASHQQALDVFREFGDRLGQAEALNSLGELLSRSATSHQARDHHARALAIARQIGVPLEEARALEGIGQCHLQDGNPGQGAAQLRQALTIYQRIGSPATQRVQQTLRKHRANQDSLTPAPER